MFFCFILLYETQRRASCQHIFTFVLFVGTQKLGEGKGNRRLTPEHRWRMNVGNWGTAPKSNGTGVFHWYTVSDGSSFGSVPEEGLCLLPSRARNFAHFVTSITSR